MRVTVCTPSGCIQRMAGSKIHEKRLRSLPKCCTIDAIALGFAFSNFSGIFLRKLIRFLTFSQHAHGTVFCTIFSRALHFPFNNLVDTPGTLCLFHCWPAKYRILQECLGAIHLFYIWINSGGGDRYTSPWICAPTCGRIPLGAAVNKLLSASITASCFVLHVPFIFIFIFLYIFNIFFTRIHTIQLAVFSCYRLSDFQPLRLHPHPHMHGLCFPLEPGTCMRVHRSLDCQPSPPLKNSCVVVYTYW